MDRYTKIKKIGEGSFGTALLVQSKTDRKNYVIKEINISKMKRKEKEEAKKEVSVLRKMKHPNIVSYTESFEELGNLYIVMDYCDGGDLYQQINARRGVLLQEDKIMDWFVQICLALKHVHDRKILHRDIKSQNIFLTSKGIIKMGDFGIARVLNNTMELARTCIGTPYYLSPEICENKPYNNKSDIWALGCVLYELCTLKHAFEAGNMKNLVLKIIRGSYPPVSPRYTYDLRNLVNQLFKRNPRDRPSVNTILKKNFIMKRIRKYLTDAQLQDEFNDAVLLRAMEGQPPKISAAVKRPADRVSEGVRISAPAAKYGAPMRKKPPAGRRPPSGDKDRRSNQSDLEQKKRDLVAKEKERRQKEMHFKAQKQKLVEKQKALQIQRAREAGWKSTLSSNGSSSGSGGGGGGGHYVPPARPLPQPKIQPQPAAGGRGGNYDHYHQYLDNINARQRVDGGVGNVALYRQEQNNHDTRRRIQERPVSASAATAARRAEMDRHIAANAADRAGVVSEFLARKRAAEANKVRAGIQMGWHPPDMAIPDRPQPQHPQPQVSAGDADYLEKLKAIRMQNFKERQMIQQKLEEGNAVKNSIEGPKIDADARRKKIEALKAQADERAAKLKEQLERQRREMFEREQKQWQEHLARKRNIEKSENAKSVPVGDKPMPIPAAATPGVSMTGVLQDVGVNVEPAETPRPKPIPEEPTKEKTPDEVAAERKKWGGGDGNNLDLANLPLQETASKMEATSTADVVTKFDDKQAADKSTGDSKPGVKDPSPRKKWGPPAKPSESKEPADDQANRKKWNPPGDTVVGLLQNAAIQPMTMTIAKTGNDATNIQGSPLGVTVVKKKGTVSSETILIKEGDNPAEPGSPQASSTPVTDRPVTEEVPGDVESDFTSGGVGEESDTSTHVTATTEDEPSEADPTQPADGGDGDYEVDSGVVSVTPSSQQEVGSGSSKDHTFVPSIRPMSAPSSNRHKSVEKTELVTVEEERDTSVDDRVDAIEDEGSKNREETVKEKEDEGKISKDEGSAHQSVEKTEHNEPNNNTDQPRDTLGKVQISSTPEDVSTRAGDEAVIVSTRAGDVGVIDSERKGEQKHLEDDTSRENDEAERDSPSGTVGEELTPRDVDVAVCSGDEHEEEMQDMAAAYQEALGNNAAGNDVDNESSSDSQDESKEAEKSVISGLSTGCFDADSRLLRTCSLPDLSQLFRTTLAFNPFFEVEQQTLAAAARGTGRPRADGDSAENDDDGNESDDECDDVTESGEQDEDEEEAYQSMVESMKHLLEAVDGTDQREGDNSPEPPLSDREVSSPTGDEEGEESSRPINEDWDSGEGSYDDEGEDEQELEGAVQRRIVDDQQDLESVFLRLEESRMELEHELGCDKFLRAYTAVQAIHEDEDENIEEGTAIVRDILGSSKQHLYTKILQLVMADGAYTEDNE